MPSAKVGITLDEQLLREVDGWVTSGAYKNRSQALQAALHCLKEQQLTQGRLLSELAKLDREEEKSLAEEWLAAETQWPPY